VSEVPFAGAIDECWALAEMVGAVESFARAAEECASVELVLQALTLALVCCAVRPAVDHAPHDPVGLARCAPPEPVRGAVPPPPHPAGADRTEAHSRVTVSLLSVVLRSMTRQRQRSNR
jgi:hypothetical protein